MSSPKANYLERNFNSPELAKLREQLKSLPMKEALDVAFAEYAVQVCAQEGPQSGLLAGAKIDGARRFAAVLMDIATPGTKAPRPDLGQLLREGELQVGKTNA